MYVRWGRAVTKLSDIFGRKSGDGSDKIIPLPAFALKAAGPAEASEPPKPSIGILAEQNETLRNLLSDTGRRIAELNQLNDVYNSIVEPFNAALSSLEREKAVALSLAARVEEQDRASEALQREFVIIEKRAKASEAEAETLRADLELASAHGRALESERRQLADDLRNLNVEADELKAKLERDGVARHTLAESEQSLREQLARSDTHALELEGELGASRERVSVLEGEKRTIQAALDEAQSENGRMARRATETENLIAAMRSQLGRLELTEAEVTAERNRLASALEEATQQRQAERQSLTNRIDALQSRVATAEGLLTEARQTLIARAEEARAFDRKATDASVARNSAERRVAQLEALQESSARKIRDLESSLNSVNEQHAVATKALQARELALARAEEKVTELGSRSGRLETELQLGRSSIDARVVELQSALARERGERSALEGALAGARRENDRLRDQIGGKRPEAARPRPESAAHDDPVEGILMPAPVATELKRIGP